MPELPEVETALRTLLRAAIGRRIVRVAPPPGTRETGGLAPAALARRLVGRRVEAAARRGKWILVELSGGAGLGLHLGMTGKLAVLDDPGAPEPRFTRAVLGLEGGRRLCFVDARRFGKLRAVTRLSELRAAPEIARVGPDALEELSLEALRAGLARTGRTVKEALLDQRIAAGVGNLYATEALWRAGLHPATPARAVAADAAVSRRVLDGLRAALRQGLDAYRDVGLPTYIEEGGDNPFFAYDRAGRPCARCGTAIEAIPLGGRTSAFCPRCQPAPPRGRRARPRRATRSG